MKKTIAVILSVLCAACLVTSIILGVSAGDSYAEKKEPYDHFMALEEGENIMFIEVKGYGIMTVELYPEEAPITVANFKKLAGENFYDGLIFHRVIEDFMIQGGDPDGDGTGGSPEKIKGEFAINGVNNTVKHERGTLSMARSTDMDSASSQFFIVHKTSKNNTLSLDGKYAAFGKVTDGVEIVDDIADVSTNAADKPLRDVVIHTVTADKGKLTAPEKPSVLDFFAVTFIFSGVTLAAALGAVVLFLAHEKEQMRLRLAAEAAAAAKREARKAAKSKKNSQ